MKFYNTLQFIKKGDTQRFVEKQCQSVCKVLLSIFEGDHHSCFGKTFVGKIRKER